MIKNQPDGPVPRFNESQEAEKQETEKHQQVIIGQGKDVHSGNVHQQVINSANVRRVSGSSAERTNPKVEGVQLKGADFAIHQMSLEQTRKIVLEINEEIDRQEKLSKKLQFREKIVAALLLVGAGVYAGGAALALAGAGAVLAIKVIMDEES